MIIIQLFQKIYNVLYWNIYTPFVNIIFHYYLKTHGVSFGKNVKTSHGLPNIINTGGSISLGNSVVFNNFAETSWYCKCDINCMGGGCYWEQCRHEWLLLILQKVNFYWQLYNDWRWYSHHWYRFPSNRVEQKKNTRISF